MSGTTLSQQLETSLASLVKGIENMAPGLTGASESDTDAKNQAAAAASSATNAANSATAATASASAAAGSESATALSATNASNSASSASSAASAASASASSASTAATNASTSASSAASSATSAGNSASTALTNASNAATSATSAALSATSAQTAATTVSTLTTSTCTFDPTKKDATVSLTGGNLTANLSGADQAVVLGNQAHQSGKYYFEILFQSGSSSSNASLGLAPMGEGYNHQIGYDDATGAVGWFQNSGNVYQNGTEVGSYTSFNEAGYTACVAVDFDNMLIWFRTNAGNWNASGTANPSTGTGGLSFTLTNALFPALCSDSQSVWVANFGGQQGFTFTPPAGFSSWGQNTSTTLAAVQAAATAAGNSGANALALTISASPFIYTAPADGMLIINSGSAAVSAMTYTRGGTAMNCLPTASGHTFVPGQLMMYKDDTITITYSVAPNSIWFVQR